MDRRVSYAGFYPTPGSELWRDVASAHAQHFALPLNEEKSNANEVAFGGGDDRRRLVVRRSDREWSEFGVFALRPKFLQAGAGDVGAWLLRLSDDLRSNLARSYFDDTVPMLEETVLGPDCLHWLQYFGPELARRWTLPFLQSGPLYGIHGFESGGVGLSLGRSPFEEMLSVKAAAEYMRIPLRPLLAKDAHGRPIEKDWP